MARPGMSRATRIGRAAIGRLVFPVAKEGRGELRRNCENGNPAGRKFLVEAVKAETLPLRPVGIDKIDK